MQTKMRLNVAKERLLIFAVFSLLFVHTISCIWIFLAMYDSTIHQCKVEKNEISENDE